MTEALAADIASCLQAAINARGTALLAVSGGSSPKSLFARLSKTDLDWSRVLVAQVDERWVCADHPDSNTRLIRENLICNNAASAHFRPLKNDATTPEEGLEACESALRSLALPFDLVLLGMGTDGHTASLFPLAPGLQNALSPHGALCAALRPPNALHARISLTIAGLLASRRLVLPLQGVAKADTLARARLPGAVEEMPIRALLRQTNVPIEIWYAP